MCSSGGVRGGREGDLGGLDAGPHRAPSAIAGRLRGDLADGSGPDTLLPYREAPPDRIIAADDITGR
ncbi:hypothetical protein [Streptomyces virginiae]